MSEDDAEYAKVLETIQGAARIIQKGVTTRSEADALSKVLLWRKAYGQLQQTAIALGEAERKLRESRGVWTSEPPTKPGWYWRRFPKDPGPPFVEHVNLQSDGQLVVVTGAGPNEYLADSIGGEWCPVQDPPL